MQRYNKSSKNTIAECNNLHDDNDRSKDVPFNKLRVTSHVDQIEDQNNIEFNKAGTSKINLLKRANSKYFTNSYLVHLLNFKDSPLIKSYKEAFFCTTAITSDNNNNYYSHYCKRKYCIVCSRIQTANRIKTYLPILQEWQDKHFVTLTQPNVKAEDLRQELTNIIKSFTKILRNNTQNYKLDIKGTRNLEITYNAKDDTYHPHLHCVVNSKEAAEYIKNSWLKQFKKANDKAQDIRPFGSNAKDLLEAFKYSQKLLSATDKGKYIYAKAIDIINISTRGGKDGVRQFQTFGFTKPKDQEITPEEITAIKEAEPTETNESELSIYKYEYKISDWVNITTGELLTNYCPSKSFVDIRENKIII